MFQKTKIQIEYIFPVSGRNEANYQGFFFAIFDPSLNYIFGENVVSYRKGEKKNFFYI